MCIRDRRRSWPLAKLVSSGSAKRRLEPLQSIARRWRPSFSQTVKSPTSSKSPLSHLHSSAPAALALSAKAKNSAG
eukprot:4135452-Pyramimonas_sp.AAC.1